MEYHIYVNGMKIGKFQDRRFVGEATALINSLIGSFLGKVEKTYPFKDKNIQMVQLFTSNDEFSKFIENNPQRIS